MNTVIIKDEDSIISSLKELYENAGYRAFKIRKFEEYSLYLENKNFLPSEYIITFNDPNGKLLALKPDITLSIVKNTKATPSSTEKLYYRESVYRFDKHSHEYREINQVGLELLGDIDRAAELESILLALRSLAAIDEHYLLQISHMGMISGALRAAGVESPALQSEILECLAAKNAHDLRQLTAECSGDERGITLLNLLAESCGAFGETLVKLQPYICTAELEEAYRNLCALEEGLEALGMGGRIKLDFSGISDMEYYNGVVFRGYIEGLAGAVLSGGRYDKLVEKFSEKIGAIGFAVYLGELVYHQAPRVYDADILLLYDENSSPDEVIRYAENLRADGRSVRVERTRPEGLQYREEFRI